MIEKVIKLIRSYDKGDILIGLNLVRSMDPETLIKFMKMYGVSYIRGCYTIDTDLLMQRRDTIPDEFNNVYYKRGNYYLGFLVGNIYLDNEQERQRSISELNLSNEILD